MLQVHEVSGDCKVTQTLATVTQLSYVIKHLMLKQRIIAATWSFLVFLALQFYIAATMTVATNLILIASVAILYILWVGWALRLMRKLDNDYAVKLAAID